MLLMAAIFISVQCLGQHKTFIDAGGTLFEILEFRRAYSIDSCLIVESGHPGWLRPTCTLPEYLLSQ